jgi:type I restriction enzyme S subunit
MSTVGKSGYRETTVGWIPADWTVTSLGAIGRCIRGVSYKPEHLHGTSSDKTVTLLRSNNIKGGRVNFDDLQFVSSANVSNDQALQPWDVAICMSNGSKALVGKSGIVKPEHLARNPNATVGAFCAIYRSKSAYMTHIFQSNYYQKNIDIQLAGSAINNLKNSDIEGVLFPLPSPPEQQKIAAILTTLDDKLDIIALQIASVQTLKQGLIQTLLRDGKSNWSIVPLQEVAEVRTGVAKGKKGLKAPVALPYLRVANVQDGHIDLTEVKLIDVEPAQVERYALRAGDVLMTEGGDFDKLGRGDVWEGQISPCLHQNHVFAVRPVVGTLNPYYLAVLAASDYGRQYFLSCSKRTTNLASINSTQLKAFPVLLPPHHEQERIAGIADALNSKIKALKSKQSYFQNVKRGLMQQLLTGAWRVKLNPIASVAAQPNENMPCAEARATTMTAPVAETV